MSLICQKGGEIGACDVGAWPFFLARLFRIQKDRRRLKLRRDARCS